MKRSGFIAASVLALAGLSPLGASAQTDKHSESSESVKHTETYEKQSNLKPEQQRHATLEVVSVDRANHTVTLRAHVSPEANLDKEGNPIRIDQLHPGDSIRAAFDPKTGDLIKVEVSKTKQSSEK